jgi:hypothetical protein
MTAPPRYQPARSLPPYAYVPGRTPHPTRARGGHAIGAPPAAPRHRPAEGWAENDEYLWGVDLYNTGYFWEAHEAWEGLWQIAPASEPTQRRFLQGLIQCAAACLKATTGDAQACRRLATRGLARLQQVNSERGAAPMMGLDVARFVAEFRAFAGADPLVIEHRPVLRLLPRSEA